MWHLANILSILAVAQQGTQLTQMTVPSSEQIGVAKIPVLLCSAGFTGSRCRSALLQTAGRKSAKAQKRKGAKQFYGDPAFRVTET